MDHALLKGKVNMGGALMQVSARTRKLKRTFHNFILTAICGFTTILVLRGSTGFENPSSTNPELESPQNSYFFSNHHRSLIKSQSRHSFLTNHDRPLHKFAEDSYFLSNRNRPFHSLANPHSQIQYIPANNGRPSSGLPITRSELQHTRLLAEVINHNSDPKPGFNPNLISTNSHSNLHPNSDNHLLKTSSTLNPIPDPLDSPLQPFSSSIPKYSSNQEAKSFNHPRNKNPKASENQDLIYKSDEFLNFPNANSWDGQRTESRLSSHYKPSILLVTGSQPFACDNPMGDYHLMKSLKNKMDYCRLHNLEIFYSMANLEPRMSGFWAKLPLIYTMMLAHPEKEWLWWLDSDAMITDMAFELPMDRYKDHNLVVHGWKELVYEQKDWVGLNTGSFLIRNCEWSLDLLEAWAPMGPKGKAREEAGHVLSKALAGRPQFEADDQSALIYLLNEQKSKWASKVYLEHAYYLHGYWLIIVDKYEEMMEKYHSGLGDDRWPFVTHFVGCKPCSNNKLPLEEKCLKHMERAFNFADNQVLQLYGFQHEDLNTHTIVKATTLS